MKFVGQAKAFGFNIELFSNAAAERFHCFLKSRLKVSRGLDLSESEKCSNPVTLGKCGPQINLICESM